MDTLYSEILWILSITLLWLTLGVGGNYSFWLWLLVSVFLSELSEPSYLLGQIPTAGTTLLLHDSRRQLHLRASAKW